MKPCARLLLCLLLLPILAAVFPTAASAVEPPAMISSQTALVYCVESNSLLYADGIDREVYPGGLVKLMTALVAYERAADAGLTLDSKITISRRVINATVGNNVPLRYNEQVRLEDLIGVMILTGANDAALAISEAVGGSFEDFIVMMNERASDLGMTHTVYRNATGIHHAEMVTTPRDLLTLALYVNHIPYLNELCGSIRITMAETNFSEVRYFGTRNYLLSDRVTPYYYLPMATGMICGSTIEAGYCAIATAQNDGLNFIAVITGAGSTQVMVKDSYFYFNEQGDEVFVPATYRTQIDGLVDAATLLNWANTNFSYIRAVDRSTPIVEVPIRLAKDVDRITLLPEKPLELFVPKDIDREKDLTLSWVLDDEELEAPLKAGQRVGVLKVTYEGETIGEVGLVVRNNIERSSWLTIIYRLKTLISTPFFLVVMGITVFAAGFYIVTMAVSRQRKKKAARKEYEKKMRLLK